MSKRSNGATAGCSRPEMVLKKLTLAAEYSTGEHGSIVAAGDERPVMPLQLLASLDVSTIVTLLLLLLLVILLPVRFGSHLHDTVSSS